MDQKNLVLVNFSILVLVVSDFFVNKPIREQAVFINAKYR